MLAAPLLVGVSGFSIGWAARVHGSGITMSHLDHYS